MELRDVPGFPDYKVGDDGSVWSFKWGKRKRMKPRTNGKGYLYVGLRLRGKTFNRYVHRLVLLVFVGDPNGLESRHMNGKRSDNRLSNLAYGTPKQNSQDAKEHGTWCRGEIHGFAKLTDYKVISMRKLRSLGRSYASLGRTFGVSAETAKSAVLGETWKHVPHPQER